MLGKEGPYDLILGMLLLARRQSWLDLRTRIIVSQDNGKDVLLGEAYAIDAVSSTTEGDAISIVTRSYSERLM